MDLVGDDRSAVRGNKLCKGRKRGRRVHSAGRIVRVAEQHGTGAVLKRYADAVEIDLPGTAGVAQRHPLDDGAGLFDQIVERWVDR